MRKIIALWLLSLALVGGLAAAVTAQVARPVAPKVFSGEDLGFRVDGLNLNGMPVGHLVIRINGDWVEVGSSMTAKPATTE